MKRQGFTQVLTGNGKGKTTAALGLALRARGHGLGVAFVEFMKEGVFTPGEWKAARELGIDVMGKGESFLFKPDRTPEQIELEVRRPARETFALARRTLLSGSYDLVILDEVNVAVKFGLVSEAQLLELIAERPPEVELVLTGRYATRAVQAAADLVSRVTLIKHPYDRGVDARAGIEY